MAEKTKEDIEAIQSLEQVEKEEEAALAEALDEDLEGLPHVTQVALERELSLQLDHLVETTDLLLLGDVVDEVLGGHTSRVARST